MEEHEPTHSGRPTRKIVDEWHKAWLVAEKIVKGEELSEQDEGWLREILEGFSSDAGLYRLISLPHLFLPHSTRVFIGLRGVQGDP
ncbi:MAG: hypothetical protein QXO42_06665 [Ignisphaera sp.]